MLVLLPPSEGKRAPADGAPARLAALVHHRRLGARRRAVLAALQELARGPEEAACAALGLSPAQRDEVVRDRTLRRAPAAPAGEVYSGVLFQELGLASLAPASRERASEHLLVASALWGVVRLEDRIPAYRLSMGARLPGLDRGLAATWRPDLTAALPDRPGRLVVDLRSGPYGAAWTPRRATVVAVGATTPDGTVVSHMAKAVRGRVARRLVEASSPAVSPQDVAALAAGPGERAELHPPARPGGPWRVQVVGPAAGG